MNPSKLWEVARSRGWRTRWFPGFAFGCWMAVLSFVIPVTAVDPSVHPLGQPIDAGEIQFTLRGAAVPGESYAVECVYRPYRERDVKKTWHLGFLGGWIGGRSKELIQVNREEFHSFRQRLTATGSNLTFTASLRDPDGDYHAYQLETVRVIARRTGTFEFERWTSAAPKLDSGFGLQCAAESMRGVLRPSGLGAQPLRGSAPLWSTLRRVDLEFVRVEVPIIRLFEAQQKHHWDGWRQTTPQAWPGGRSIVVRHVSASTVWREHEYDPFPSAREVPVAHPRPLAEVLPGVQLEVFWPEGEPLSFPETRFEADVEVVAVPVSQLPPRLRELLAQSVRLRPGWEPAALSAQEWKELKASVPELDLPLSLQMVPSAEGETTLRLERLPGFKESWLCLFGAAFDDHRRFVITSLLVRPERWTGPLPQ
ncbi:MAG: hypothetical protein J0M24_19100 [Verrucomicrobia bacterium]|nr:hypothetical protein [Verrucomicrobiota bacterium]